MSTNLSTNSDIADLRAENVELRTRLAEADETLAAIRGGQVDALVIGDQIYTLESADAASNRFRGEVLTQISDVVIAVDNDRHITYMNPAAERQYHCSASEVMGRRLSSLYDYRWVNDVDQAAADESLAKHGFWRGENIQIKQNGKEMYVEMTVSQLRNRSGQADGLLAVIRDISERKRAELELREAHAALDARVKERTQELADANISLEKEIKNRGLAELQRTELLQRLVTSQEDERRRIARDIHDHLGQRLTGLRLQVASFAEYLRKRGEYSTELKDLVDTARDLDAEVSLLAWELRPATLDELGFAEAAKAFLGDWSEQYSIDSDISVRLCEEKAIRPKEEIHLYRILQESLNNVAKHAKASKVNVLVETSEDEVTLIVEDDGIGFQQSRPQKNHGPADGLGLLSMKERALLIGADLQVESCPGIGTTVFVRVRDSVLP